MSDYAIHDTTLIGTSNIIRKKEGSSALIDPADYPKRINLMGMLEEKTVSSSPIVTFADGADEVPLKKCEITLPASLDGYSEIDVVHAGKNLLNDSIRGHAGANIYFGHDTGLQNEFSVRLRAGTYTFSVVTADGTVSNLHIKNSDTDTNLTGFPAYATLSKTFTLSEDTNCAVFVYKSGYTDVTDILTAQIEAGSTATTYEPYTAPDTHTADLGRTIYGGSGDVVNGQGVDDKVTYTLDENDSWAVYSGASHSFWHNVATGDVRPIEQTKASESICNHATFSSVSPASAPNWTFTIQGGQRIVVTADSTIDTVEKFQTWLESNTITFVCPSSTPETFTFDPVPIDSKLGNNTLWAEQGSSAEVTYRGQGTVYQYPEGEGVSF